jgi:hypothetical protein
MTSMPNRDLNGSRIRWFELPIPTDANVIVAGL